MVKEWKKYRFKLIASTLSCPTLIMQPVPIGIFLDLMAISISQMKVNFKINRIFPAVAGSLGRDPDDGGMLS